VQLMKAILAKESDHSIGCAARGEPIIMSQLAFDKPQSMNCQQISAKNIELEES
jgi:hypothetical protein